jgi:hypothetical protein
MKRYAIILGLAALAGGCGGPGKGPGGVSDPMPEWDPKPIALAASSDLGDIQDNPCDFAILTWKIENEEHALRVERCLVWMKFTLPETKGRWLLASMYRYPTFSSPAWHIDAGPDGKELQRREFSHAPGTPEMDSFLAWVNWKFGPSDRADLLAGEVCKNAWKTALGSRPNKAYPKVPKAKTPKPSLPEH